MNELWLATTAEAALQGGHIYPEMAACEAAEESNYGLSLLAREDNNLFGMKQHQHPAYGTVSLPTREFLDGTWQVVDAKFVKYPDHKSCFADRMDTLTRMANYYPHYREALNAPGPIEYAMAVSKNWSTDPQRAAKVIGIYNEWQDRTG